MGNENKEIRQGGLREIREEENTEFKNARLLAFRALGLPTGTPGEGPVRPVGDEHTAGNGVRPWAGSRGDVLRRRSTRRSYASAVS